MLFFYMCTFKSCLYLLIGVVGQLRMQTHLFLNGMHIYEKCFATSELTVRHFCTPPPPPLHLNLTYFTPKILLNLAIFTISNASAVLSLQHTRNLVITLILIVSPLFDSNYTLSTSANECYSFSCC